MMAISTLSTSTRECSARNERISSEAALRSTAKNRSEAFQPAQHSPVSRGAKPSLVRPARRPASHLDTALAPSKNPLHAPSSLMRQRCKLQQMATPLSQQASRASFKNIMIPLRAPRPGPRHVYGTNKISGGASYNTILYAVLYSAYTGAHSPSARCSACGARCASGPRPGAGARPPVGAQAVGEKSWGIFRGV